MCLTRRKETMNLQFTTRWVLFVPVVSSTRQGSINRLVCVSRGCIVMILWGLVELVSLFQNIAKPEPIFLHYLWLRWHWGWSLPGYLSPNWDRNNINGIIRFMRDCPIVESQVFTPNIPCLPWLGIGPWPLVCLMDVLTTTLSVERLSVGREKYTVIDSRKKYIVWQDLFA